MDMDDFIKKSFEQGDFAMKDAYWQSASAMLDRHYRRRRWKRWAWIFTFFMGVTGIFWFAFIDQQPNDFSANKGSLSTPIKNAPAFANPAKEGQDIVINEGSNSRSDIKENSVSESSNVAGNDPHSFSLAQKSRTAQQAKSMDVNRQIVAGNSPLELKGNEQKREEKAEIHVALVNDEAPRANLSEDAPTGLNAIPIDFLANQNVLVDNEMRTLPLPEMKVTREQEWTLNFTHDNKPITMPRFKPYWEPMVFAQVLAYPGLAASAKKVLGGQLGIEGRYFFSKQWFIRMALAGGVRLGSFAPSVYSTQRSFFLGPQDNAYVTRPGSLWYGATPIQMGYRSGKNVFLAGVTPQYLLGVYGSLEYAQENLRSGDMSYEFEQLEKGWINREGFRSVVVTYTLGYTRQLQERLHVGLSLQMIPFDWVNNTYGRKYEYAMPGYEAVNSSQKGLIEKNWLISFNVHYSLR